MYLNEQQTNFIKQESLNDYPNEAVFATVGREVHKIPNTHPHPDKYFRVDEYEVVHRIKATSLVHSHTIDLANPRPEFAGAYVDPRVPSKADMIAQMNLDIPFGIIATDGTELSEILWFPDLDHELIGRPYIANVYDCYELIRSWYWQERGIYIPPNPREYAFWRESPNEVLDKYRQFGFESVTDDEFRIGDVFVLRILGNYTSHIGLYIGDDQFIHHMNDQVSKVESLPRWRDRIIKKLRHRDLI